MCLDQRLDYTKFRRVETNILGKLDFRIEPVFRLTLCRADMNMKARLLPGKEEKAIRAFPEDRRTHRRPPGCLLALRFFEAHGAWDKALRNRPAHCFLKSPSASNSSPSIGLPSAPVRRTMSDQSPVPCVTLKSSRFQPARSRTGTSSSSAFAPR